MNIISSRKHIADMDVVCLSYDPLKLDFIAFKMNLISSRKHIVDMDVVNDVMLRFHASVIQPSAFNFSYLCNH